MNQQEKCHIGRKEIKCSPPQPALTLCPCALLLCLALPQMSQGWLTHSSPYYLSPPETNPTEFPSAVTSTGRPCLTCVQREVPGQSLLATKHFSTHVTGKQLVVKFPRWQSISHLQPQLFCFCAKKHKAIFRTLKTCRFHSVEPCRRHIKCSTLAACCVIWHMSSFRKETPIAGKEMNLSYSIFHTHSKAEC